MKIYHSNRLHTPYDDEPINFPEEYTLVAIVETNDVDEAYKMTQHLGLNWGENPKVTLINPSRSSTYGDVFVNDDGVEWFCDLYGWIRVK